MRDELLDFSAPLIFEVRLDRFTPFQTSAALAPTDAQLPMTEDNRSHVRLHANRRSSSAVTEGDPPVPTIATLLHELLCLTKASFPGTFPGTFHLLRKYKVRPLTTSPGCTDVA